MPDADLIDTNARITTMNEATSEASAPPVRDGPFYRESFLLEATVKKLSPCLVLLPFSKPIE